MDTVHNVVNGMTDSRVVPELRRRVTPETFLPLRKVRHNTEPLLQQLRVELKPFEESLLIVWISFYDKLIFRSP